MLRERRRHANYKPNRRLDRKSSRGMIYENEELRLRTININAEVERGQSDIRKLRRENELLKREIWSLRDEYDRINKKKMCAKKNCGSCENNININSDSQTEDSDSCDTCKEDDFDNDDQTDDQQCLEERENHDNGDISKQRLLSSQSARATKSSASLSDILLPTDNSNQEIVENYENFQKTLAACDAAAAIASTSSSSSNSNITTTTSSASPISKHNCKAPPSTESVSNKLRENLHVNFGHLSVLSEENSTNSSDGASINDNETVTAAALTITGYITQQQQSSNQFPTSPLREIQSVLPPLSHFENIPYDQIGQIAASLDDLNYSTSTTTTGETVIPTSGWDFNMKSAGDGGSDYDPKNDHNDAQDGPGESGGSSSSSTQYRSPKHFFSPIKPRLQPPFRQQQTAARPSHHSPLQQANPPDLFVANALASPYQRPSCTAVDHNASSLPTRPHSPNSSYQDGNLEDLLLEIESLQMQLEKHKSFSQEKLSTSEFFSNRKPYRSEMNLVVSCNGSKPVITPITKTTSASLTTGFAYNSNYFSPTTTTTPTTATNSISIDTPPPNLPNPMILFPQNLTYLTRDAYGGPCSTGSVPVLTDITEYPAIVPVPKVRGPVALIGDIMLPPPPSLPLPLPSALTMPTTSGSTTASSIFPTTKSNIDGMNAAPAAPMIGAAVMSAAASAVKFGSPKLQSRKSPAAMRRKLFSNRDEESPSAATATSSTDGIAASEKFSQTADSMASDNFQNDSSSGSDTTKRKTPRRVSIIFNSGSSSNLGGGSNRKSDEKEKEKEKERDRRTEENTLTNKTTTSDLGTSLTNNLLQKSQKFSHELVTQSTPNSPHSGTRRNSTAHSLSSAQHHHNHTHHKDHHHHHGNRKWSQDSVKSAKCSRRYSEGTVDSIAAISNSSPFNSTYGGGGAGSGGGGGTTTSSDGGAHNHDSFHEPGTSISERNSNSFGSSRESSTSQSTHSQRRKISVSSHNGGKIPWCGCWGNGCL